MYFDFTVEIPDVKGKIVKNKIRNTTYVCYEFDRVYNPEKKYNTPKRTTIGKVCEADPDLMYPNPNFLKFFPDAEIPEINDSERSRCLKAGTYFVIRKIIEDYGLDKLLAEQFDERSVGLLLDLVTYSIITESTAGQYYPDYAYNHPLFTPDMKQYSDSTISNFLRNMDADSRIGFLDSWNSERNLREDIYISYDSTNKNCQAGDVDIAEFGYAKEDKSKPIINYSVAYDKENKEPLFYEGYGGSINDVSQFQLMVNKAKAFGYSRIGFILDRGYFSKANIRYMDTNGFHFIIMLKGMKELVSDLVLEVKGTFEEKRSCAVKGCHVYGTTVRRKMFPSDKSDRYFHVFYSSGKASHERADIENKLETMNKNMKRMTGLENVNLGTSYEKYYEFMWDKEGLFIGGRELEDVVERELKLSGYFVLITSKEMTAEEAYRLYKSRDVSEKLFRGDKSYLGNGSFRNHSQESIESKIFVEFIALIVRNKMHTLLREENDRLKSRENYMNVSAAIHELEKIEMVKLLDGVYIQDHAITKKQKTILRAFGINAHGIKAKISNLSNKLRQAES